jgi:predicted peptidase
MSLGRAAVAMALAGRAVSLGVHVDEVPELAGPEQANTSRVAIQWSETRLGPPMLVSEACSVAWNFSNQSEWMERDPVIFPEAGIGARRRMVEMDGMEYQLFLPRGWGNNTLYPHPTVIYFHSHPERKWTLMNSESLPRMLARNQSQSFDNRSCWCLSASGYDAYEESSDASKAYEDSVLLNVTGDHVADCTFADTFHSLVIMPQGWVKKETPGWTASHFATIKNITRAVMEKFNGDADKVIVTGTAEGGAGALEFAKTYPGLVSAAIITDAPAATYDSQNDDLEGLPVYVTADGSLEDAPTVDALVVSLKGRASGVTRYTRYTSAPAAADPEYWPGPDKYYYDARNHTYGHSSDIIYRDPQLWAWATSFKIQGGREKWGASPLPYVLMH